MSPETSPLRAVNGRQTMTATGTYQRSATAGLLGGWISRLDLALELGLTVDKQAVTAAYGFCGIATPDFRWSDSVTIARRAWPELKGNGGHGLANLKRTLNLQFHHHDAGEDARAAALVVLHAEKHLAMPFEQLIVPAVKPRYSAKPTKQRFVGWPTDLVSVRGSGPRRRGGWPGRGLLCQ